MRWSVSCGAFLASVTWAAAPHEAAPPKVGKVLGQGTPSIRVEPTPPMTVVYVEHTGPYWTVRARLRQVVDYMRAHGLSGELYVRYGSSPMGPNAAHTKGEVGFVADPDYDPEAPFHKAKRPAEWVASMSIECTGSIAPHEYRALSDWIETNGHRAQGPVIERYPKGFGSGDDGRSGFAVILQMPIEPPTKPQDTGTTAPKDTTQSGDANTSAPTAKAVEPSAEDASPSEPSEAEAPPFVDDGSKTTAELLDIGEVDAIARRLMPDDTPIPRDADLWLGQVVFRVSAVAKGIEKTYPGEGGKVAALAEAIRTRYRQASAQQSDEALAQVVVRVSPKDAQAVQERRALLQDFDRLLSRIAGRAVDAEGARASLAAELDRVVTVLQSARRPTPDGG